MKHLGLAAIAVVVFAMLAPDAAWAEERGYMPPPPNSPTLVAGDADVRCCRPPCPCCCLRDQRCGWTLSGGFLFMRREDPDSQTIVEDQQQQDVLNADEFEFGYEPGFELALTKHRLFGCVDLELKGFWVSEWSDSITKNPPTLQAGGFIPTDPPIFVPDTETVESEYESQLAGIELNARWRFPCLQRVRWLAGFRCLNLEEELNTMFTFGTIPPSNFDVETENVMCGVQIGADVDIISAKCFCLRAFLKGGIFLNQAEQETTLGGLLGLPSARLPGTQQGAPPSSSFSDDDDDTAWLVEGGLSAVWCLSRNFALRADYRVLFIDGVALASDQIPAIDPVSGSGIDTDSSVLFHGLYLGVDWYF